MARIARWWIATLLGMLLAGCVAGPTAGVQQSLLAPTGKLRVALIDGSPANVLRDAAGTSRGVGYELGRELAKRLDVPLEMLLYASVDTLLEAGRAGKWDVTFNGITPDRAEHFDATPPHLELELGYLVPRGSRIASFAQVDQPGVRVGVSRSSAVDIALARTLKNARLVRAAGLAGNLDLMRSGDVDVIAANKPNLEQIAQQLPGARLLEGSPGVEAQGLLVPKGRGDAALRYARQFIGEAKSSGLVKGALDRAGLHGARVAP
jgi:polar amino acid transport system substrate-binding protein